MSDDSKQAIRSPNTELIVASEVPALLDQIRPAWRAKSLISRVQRLIAVDPSSACQRLLNAAIHDLREKIIVAGIDIASDAANQHKLPPIDKPEDVENYSTSRLIDLAYRMGLLRRPEWRRVSRCYEIRRDLEHEDDEYEAGVEDCIYIFKTCIEVILARDPIHVLKVKDVRTIVEEAEPVTASEALIEDFAHAPQPRQEEIFRFLISIALDKSQPDIVQENAYTILNSLEQYAQNQVKLDTAQHIQGKLGRGKLDRRHVRIALASGTLPYLRKNQIKDFFEAEFDRMKQVGTDWTAYDKHGDLLRAFRDVGGLQYCPAEVRKKILRYLVVTFLGTPGGMTRFGNVRHVFYSNTAAPIIQELISQAAPLVKEEVIALSKDKTVRALSNNKHIARRFEELLDIVDSERG